MTGAGGLYIKPLNTLMKVHFQEYINAYRGSLYCMEWHNCNKLT